MAWIRFGADFAGPTTDPARPAGAVRVKVTWMYHTGRVGPSPGPGAAAGAALKVPPKPPLAGDLVVFGVRRKVTRMYSGG